MKKYIIIILSTHFKTVSKDRLNNPKIAFILPHNKEVRNLILPN